MTSNYMYSTPLLDLIQSSMSPHNRMAVRSYGRAKEFLALNPVPAADWELRLFGDPEQVEHGRTSLLVAALNEGRSSDECASLMARWHECAFDAVSVDNISIGGLCVPFPIALGTSGPLGLFPTSPCQVDEVDFHAPHSDDGRKDLLSVELAELQWGCDLTHPRSVLALRTKIPGSRFVKRKVGQDYFLSGFKDLPIPVDFPVELCEYYSGKFFVLFPYSCPHFEYLGYQFVPHEWKAPQKYSFDIWGEGVMILTPSGEIRCRTFPSGEVRDYGDTKGVWEFGFGIFGDEPVYFPIRPRPGKPTGSQAQTLNRIGSCVPSTTFLQIKEETNWDVVTCYSGPLKGTISKENGIVYLDSGLREMKDTKYPRYHQSEQLKPPPKVVGLGVPQPLKRSTIISAAPKPVPIPTPPTPSGPKIIEGAKIFLFTQKHRLVMVQERSDKKWDLPGGHLEQRESPFQALMREVEEETGILLDPNWIVSMGISKAAATTDQAQYISHVFLGITNQTPPSNHGASAIATYDWETAMKGPMSNFQPWYPRHVDHLRSYSNDLHNLLGRLVEMRPTVQLGTHDAPASASIILKAVDEREKGSVTMSVLMRLCGHIPDAKYKIWMLIGQGRLIKGPQEDFVITLPQQGLPPAHAHLMPSIHAPPERDSLFQFSPPPSVDFTSSSRFLASPFLSSSAMTTAAATTAVSSSGKPELTPEQQKVVDFVRRNPGCTTQVLKKACGPSAAVTGYALKNLLVVVDASDGSKDRSWKYVGPQ